MFQSIMQSMFGGGAAPFQEVDVASLKALLDKQPDLRLIDVRSADEYRSGHAPGALNIPLEQVGDRVADFGKAGDEVYVICLSGGRSGRACAQLAAQGLKPVNVAGGTGAWRRAGFAVE